FKEYWQRNSPGGPAGAKNRETNGSVTETATSGGCHSPGDSATGIDGEGPTSSAPLKDLESLCQELPAALDSRSVKISQLKKTIKSLKQQKKHVEHQLEEEKKANIEKQKTERELEVQIQRLNMQKGKLSPDLYHTKRSLRYFEEESKDLVSCLQRSLQHTGELEQALSAVTATQKKKANQFSSRSQALTEWQLEQSIQEKARLRERLTRMRESLKQAQLERDEYAQHLKGERARWQGRRQPPVCMLKKEKKHDMRRIENLERRLSTLKNQMDWLPPGCKESLSPPAVPSEVELQHLRKELERVSAELQVQVENNQRVSLLNRGQKERLREQEERLQQLAEPQSDFEELNNENKSALQLEQQVKEWQEKLDKVRETVTSAPSKKGGEAGTSLWGGVCQARDSSSLGAGDTSHFMDHLEEKVNLREQYWRERCHHSSPYNRARGSAKDAAMGRGHHQAGPGQGGDEGEAAGAAGDAVTACGDYNKENHKFLATSQNPADEPGPGAPVPQELGAAYKACWRCTQIPTSNSPKIFERPGRVLPTTTILHSQSAQEHQEHPGLGSNRSVPFFCWAWLQRRKR
uniref:Golgin subfamily A conserved domain-containing protein n=1 Tax=Colobus angolensis palliatus TaxID=336983 RepID=A0A2K5IMJ6_COLAP